MSSVPKRFALKAVAGFCCTLSKGDDDDDGDDSLAAVEGVLLVILDDLEGG